MPFPQNRIIISIMLNCCLDDFAYRCCSNKESKVVSQQRHPSVSLSKTLFGMPENHA
jgi:hypothetical protein